MESTPKELQDRREKFYLDCVKDFMSQMATEKEMSREEIVGIIVSSEHYPNSLERNEMLRHAINSAKDMQNILFNEDGTLRTPEESFALLDEALSRLKEEAAALTKKEHMERMSRASRIKRGIYESMTQRFLDDSGSPF